MSGLSCSAVTCPAVAFSIAKHRSFGGLFLSHLLTAQGVMPIALARADVLPKIEIARSNAVSFMTVPIKLLKVVELYYL